MLLVQNITLVWYKDSRGAPGGAVRARFPLAHPITKAASPLPPGEAVVHSLRFYQWSPEEIITNREECRRGLERHLPRLGFSREETAGLYRPGAASRLPGLHPPEPGKPYLPPGRGGLGGGLLVG